MGSPDLDAAYHAFTTTVGLITTNGSKGPNVMAAEWTFHVSYEPFLIAVLVDPENATHAAITETGEFGVNLVSEEQVAPMGFAGHFSKHDTDKLSSELFETYPGGRIKAPMLRSALLNAECRVVKEVPMGDHTAFVGEVLAFSVDSTRKPIVLHRGPRQMGARIPRVPAIAVAATPMRASPGARVAVDGEMVAPDRGDKAIEVSVVGPQGQRPGSVATRTNAHGYFHAELTVPTEWPKGTYALEARGGQATGRARLEVV